MPQEMKAQDKTVVSDQAEPTRDGLVFVPSVDIYESEEGLTLLADMPGVEKDGLTIDLKDNTLSIRGVPSGADVSGRKLLYREYEEGEYKRQFTVNEMIDQNAITARLKNGVLSLFLPKVKPLAPRRIEVTGE